MVLVRGVTKVRCLNLSRNRKIANGGIYVYLILIFLTVANKLGIYRIYSQMLV